MIAHRQQLVQARVRWLDWLARLLVRPVWLVRVYMDGSDYERRDPYEFSCVARSQRKGEVELIGVDKPVSRDTYRAVRGAFPQWRVVRERHNTDEPRVKVLRH